MKREVIQATTLAAAVAALATQAVSAPRHAGTQQGKMTIAGHSCSGKNGCGSKPKDPNEKKTPQGIV